MFKVIEGFKFDLEQDCYVNKDGIKLYVFPSENNIDIVFEKDGKAFARVIPNDMNNLSKEIKKAYKKMQEE